MATSMPAPNGAAGRAPWVPGVIVVLLINAVPLVGVLWFDWSAINVLVLYWFENLMIAIGTSIRLIVHRKLTRKRGYWRVSSLGTDLEVNGRPVKTGIIGEYAIAAFGFTLAHGIFVVGIVYLIAQNHPDDAMWQLSVDQVLRGVGAICAMLAVQLAIDLATIRQRSFAAMKNYVQGRMGRVAILHLVIIFGMFGMAMTNSPFSFLYVLIGLKTLVDLAGVAVRTMAAPAVAAAPPAWMLKSADRLAKDKGGAAGLLDKWQRDQDTERRNASEDEQVMPA